MFENILKKRIYEFLNPSPNGLGFKKINEKWPRFPCTFVIYHRRQRAQIYEGRRKVGPFFGQRQKMALHFFSFRVLG